MKNFIVKALVRTINAGKVVKFAAPSKGTVRFNVYKSASSVAPIGSGFYRIRSKKSRPLELIEGETFKTLHAGKISIGIETHKVRSTWDFAGK